MGAIAPVAPRIAAPASPPTHGVSTDRMGRRFSPLPAEPWRGRQSEKHQHGLIETQDILAVEPAARAPTLDFGTVVILSTIIRQARRSPFRRLAARQAEIMGLRVSSVVKAQIESVASKLSSCTMTAGRGLPA
jgi:hypothetical protein